MSTGADALLSSKGDSTPWRAAAQALAAVGLGFGVFVLPYLVPPDSPIQSASSLSGFNNTIAYASYVAGLGLTALVSSRRGARGTPGLTASAQGALFVVPPPLVLAIIAGHAALFAALYLRTHGFVFAEALYFEDAAYRAASGQLPFVGFRFFYGPLLVFPSSLLTPVLGVWLAYAVHFVGSYLLGLYFLYVVVAQLFETERQRLFWYALFAIGLFTPISGLNYTLFRFLLPVISMLVLWRCTKGATLGRWLQAVVVVAAAVLCSPDMAVVTIVGAAVLVTVAAVQPRPALRPIALTAIVPVASVAIAIASLLLIDGSWTPVDAYLRPVATFSSGGWNTQVDPSLPTLSLIALTSVAVIGLWNTFWNPDFAAAQPLVGAYAIVLLLMQRASFGKADIVHIAYSGLPAFLAAAAVVVRTGHQARVTVLASLFAVGIVLPLQFYHSLLFVPALTSRLQAAPATAPDQPPAAVVSKAAVQAALTRAVEHFGPDKIYYMHRLEYYRLPIYVQYHLKPFLSHPSLTSAFTTADIAGVIDELRSSDAIVLALRDDLVSGVVPQQQIKWWTYAFSAPVPGSTVFNLTTQFQSRLEAPLVAFLTSEYDETFLDGPIVGLTRRTTALARRAPQR